MNFLHAIILGIVEGVTEFLPISSTGHLIIASRLLSIPQTDFVKSFEIIIQLGAILAVAGVYWKKIISNFSLGFKAITAFIPTAIIGLIFYKPVKLYLIGNTTVVLWSLLLGGIAIILVELWLKKYPPQRKEISYPQAALIGTAQAVSVIPGVSRSAATIIGGMLAGIRRETIVEFSFILALPTMAAATGLDLVKTSINFSLRETELLAVGFIVSFIVALSSIKWFLSFIKNRTFIGFGIYRIVAAIVFFFLLR